MASVVSREKVKGLFREAPPVLCAKLGVSQEVWGRLYRH